MKNQADEKKMSYEEYADSLIKARKEAEERAEKRQEEVAKLRAEVEPKMRALCSAFRAHRICVACPAYLYNFQKKCKVCELEELLKNNPEWIVRFLKRTPDNDPYESSSIIAISKEKERLDKSNGGDKITKPEEF